MGYTGTIRDVGWFVDSSLSDLWASLFLSLRGVGVPVVLYLAVAVAVRLRR